MYCYDNEGDDVTPSADYRNSALTEHHVDFGVDGCGKHVANEGREKNERHHCTRHIIVLLDLVLQEE